jgi:hypothetical protein
LLHDETFFNFFYLFLKYFFYLIFFSFCFFSFDEVEK